MRIKIGILMGLLGSALTESAIAFPVPPVPERVLRESNAVAVGTLVKEKEIWKLKIVKSLRGGWSIGEKVAIYPVSDTFHFLITEVGEEPFLFCGQFLKEENVLLPIFEMSSAMPMGVPEELLADRTLAGTVEFAERVMGLQKSEEAVPESWRINWPSPRAFMPALRPVVLTPELEDAQVRKLEALREAKLEADRRIKETWLEEERERKAALHNTPPQARGNFGLPLTPFELGILIGLLVSVSAVLTGGRFIARRRRRLGE